MTRSASPIDDNMLDELVWRVGATVAFVERQPLLGQDHPGLPFTVECGRVWWKLGARRPEFVDAFANASASKTLKRSVRKRLSRYTDELRAYRGATCEESLWAVCTLANYCLDQYPRCAKASDREALRVLGEELCVAAAQIGRAAHTNAVRSA